MIQNFEDFVNEGRHRQMKHPWANPFFNKKELQKYDSLPACFKKVTTAAEILSINHKTDININYDDFDSNKTITIVFLNTAGPLSADLQMFTEEYGQQVEVQDTDFGSCLIYHLTDEEYQSMKGTWNND